MPKVFRKYVAVLVLLTFSFSGVNKAEAIVPVVVAGYVAAADLSSYLAGSIIVHAAVGGGILYYLLGDSAGKPDSHKVNEKDVFRETDVTWVDLESIPDEPPKPVVKQGKVETAIPLVALIEKVGVDATAAVKAKFPALHNAIVNQSGDYSLDTNSAIGSVGKIPGLAGHYRVTNKWESSAPYPAMNNSDIYGGWATAYFNPPGIVTSGKLQLYVVAGTYGGTASYYKIKEIHFTSSAPPPPTNKDPYQVKKALLGQAPEAPRDSDYTERKPMGSGSIFKGEIDDFIMDNPNVIHFEESGSSEMHEPPEALTVDQADAAATAHQNHQVKKVYAATLAANAATAQQRAATAEAKATAAEAAAAAANGFDQGLNAAAAQARAAADEASAAAGTATAASAAAEAEAAEAEDAIATALPKDNNYDTAIETPEKKDISVLLGNIIGGSPIATMVKTFTISTSDATGKITVGQIYGKDFEFDFARYQETFNKLGGVLLVITHGFAVLVVVRRW